MAVGGTYARLLHRQMLEQDIESTSLDGTVKPLNPSIEGK